MSIFVPQHTGNSTDAFIQLVKNKPRNQSHSRKKGRRSTTVPRHKTPDSLRPRGIFAREKIFTGTFQNVLQIYCGPHPSLFFLQPQDRATSPFDSSPSNNI